MLPVVALIGRPNVGKSTLFNQLTRSRDALVADQPGLTRDRNYGLGKLGSRSYLVVDTGGIADDASGIGALIEKQVLLAIEEADQVLLLLDGKAGCCAADEMLARRLRALGKPITAVVNKTENQDPDLAVAEFHSLGLGSPIPIAAAHGQGVRDLIDQVLDSIPEPPEEAPTEAESSLQIAVVGRPNVGKSTLVNRLLGEERVLAFDRPGTTRDSIFIPFSRNGRSYTLVDTAGLRRRARVREAVEKFSVIKTLQAIEQSNAIILMLDARQGIGDQDAHIAGHVMDSGRALVIAVNKWDGLETDQRARIRRQIEQKLPFLDFASVRFVSALRGSGMGRLLDAVEEAYANATRDLKASELTNTLKDAVAEHQPPLSRGRRIKLRYAHQGGRNPPVIVIHGNQTDAVPPSYRRYLVNRFRHALRLEGTPIRIEFKTGANPFSDKKNKLTPRQMRKRQRLKRFVNRK